MWEDMLCYKQQYLWSHRETAPMAKIHSKTDEKWMAHLPVKSSQVWPIKSSQVNWRAHLRAVRLEARRGGRASTVRAQRPERRLGGSGSEGIGRQRQ